MKRILLAILLFALASPLRAAVRYVTLNAPMRAGESLVVDGIPFRKGDLWDSFKEGGALRLSAFGVKAESVFVLGGVNSWDRANPDWGGGDSVRNLFVGDKLGAMTIEYESGRADEIPLIYGETVWCRGPYESAPEPFQSDAAMRARLDQALCVAHGIEPGARDTYLKIALRPEPVKAIAFADNVGKAGHFTVEGITFAGAENPGVDLLPAEGGEIPDEMAKWLDAHTIRPDLPHPAGRENALREVAKTLSTSPDDITFERIRATPARVNASNFAGPKVRFEGTPIAELLTNIYYENSDEILGRVDDDGTVHESHAKADYYSGFGGWRPGLGAFYGASYTRLRALTLLGNMGFSAKADKSIAFFDKWLMYFPKSFPTIQLGGKPVPGHTTVIANKPHVYFDELRNVGWPTRYKTRDFGNPENDGHGMLMLTRWRSWVKQGRDPKWVNDRWEALNEAAEYIPWCLDNPDLSFSAHGLLYNESEGGMTRESLFCDVPCYLGLLGYAEMADAAGKHDKAMRWREQADRLFKAMDAWYPRTLAPWGDVWDPEKTAGFCYLHATLAPVILGMDLWGYDAINHLPKAWAERTRRTYKRQLTMNQPPFCAPAGIGYGQCYITESALLLDQMSDADKLVTWMARLCFAPRQPNPYRVPEGGIVATDGSQWRRWGDLGNLYQLAEVVYTIQLMLGIDDLSADQVILMPRIPVGWTAMSVKDWPVRTRSKGQSAGVKLSIELKRDKAGSRFDLTLKADRPIDSCRVRLGPFPAKSRDPRVSVDGRMTSAKAELIGDSRWAWVTLKPGASHVIHAAADGRL